MNVGARHHHTAPAPADPAGLLQRGLELLGAHRAAMVDGDPIRLATANTGLVAWLAGLSSALSAQVGSDSSSIGRSDAARMRAALEANAAVAQRAAASTQRALAALLAPPQARTYEADGRPSERAAVRTSLQA